MYLKNDTFIRVSFHFFTFLLNFHFFFLLNETLHFNYVNAGPELTSCG